MSILFTSFVLGNVEIKNRFVFSACEDNLATEDGLVTDAIIRKNQRLAKGEVGLILSSHLSVINHQGKIRHRPKLLHLKQIGAAPPRFQLITVSKEALPEAFVKFIEKRLRERFGFLGAPIKLEIRQLKK